MSGRSSSRTSVRGIRRFGNRFGGHPIFDVLGDVSKGLDQSRQKRTLQGSCLGNVENAKESRPQLTVRAFGDTAHALANELLAADSEQDSRVRDPVRGS
jgi:hypothetical protein